MIQAEAISIVRWYHLKNKGDESQAIDEILATTDTQELLDIVRCYTSHWKIDGERVARDICYYESGKQLEFLKDATAGRFLAMKSPAYLEIRQELLQKTRSGGYYPVYVNHYPKIQEDLFLWAGGFAPETYCQGDPWGIALEYSAHQIAEKLTWYARR